MTVELAERFHGLSHISLAELRAQVRACLIAAETVLLSDVLHRYPPREGILEVAGYLVLAMQDSNHYVAPDQRCDVLIDALGEEGVWSVPEALFTRDAGVVTADSFPARSFALSRLLVEPVYREDSALWDVLRASATRSPTTFDRSARRS